MDEEHSQAKENDESPPQQFIEEHPPSRTTGEQVITDEAAQQQADKGAKQSKYWHRFLQKPRDIGVDRYIELLLTLAIAYFAYSQVRVAENTSAGTTTQMEKIIAAADRINNAATSFSGSAARIDKGLGSAVATLQGQASEMDQARMSSEKQSTRSLKAATEEGRADLRAYLVTTLEKPQESAVYCDPIYGQVCARFQYVNVGRTPAVAIKVVSFVVLETRFSSVKFPMVVEKYTGLQGAILGNSSPGTGTTNPARRPVPPCEASGYHQTACGQIIYGLIRYKDIFGDHHETGFCTFFPNTNQFPPVSCPTGNWFDKRPSGFVEER